MEEKFIIGKSGIPENAGLSKLLVFDVIDNRSMITPIYEIDSGSEIIYATKDGVNRIKPIGDRYKSYEHIIEEPEGFSVIIFDKAVERMLSDMIINGNLLKANSEVNARKTLDVLDIGCDRILTKDDLSTIPEGMNLAVCAPEFLGYMYAWGTYNFIATKWGAFLHNDKNSLVLFPEIKCSACEKKFRNNNELISHIRTTTDSSHTILHIHEL